MAGDGQSDAHTPPDAPAPQLAGGDPLDLLSGSPELDPQDVLELVAEISAAPRRARGRPEGAANRKNGDMVRLLAARGHRDPWVTLSLIQSADFLQLCKLVGATTAKLRLAVLGVQRAAAADIMPYHHGKRPQQLDLKLPGNQRPLIMFGDLNVAVVDPDGFMSAGEMPPGGSEENQGLIEGEAVRMLDESPHNTANALIPNDDPGEST